MKITQVAIASTSDSRRAGRPELTPELLAATGARYSRSNEGLETILGRIDPGDPDKSVDSIFRLVDYGHQSIADMVPVAMFIDGISIWLAYHVWTLCPTASGQESSTRYLKFSSEGLISANDLGIPETKEKQWHDLMTRCYECYGNAVQLWEGVSESHPYLARIPVHNLSDPSDKARKQAARMRRNYAFDRARYFLPAAAATNIMLLMSARGWVQLCQQLLSHPLPEPQRLGQAIATELRFSAPRMLKHATQQASTSSGLLREMSILSPLAAEPQEHLRDDAFTCEHPSKAYLDFHLPSGASAADIGRDFDHHENRYAWVGETLKRTQIRFGWSAVAFAEIRDLNRHRTGHKFCPLIPQGFYFAADQLPKEYVKGQNELSALSQIGKEGAAEARRLLASNEPAHVYWTLLGTQFPFEHATMADKFIYEAELRTGVGAHYRYAVHLRESLSLWYQHFPETKGRVLEGSAEPE